MGKCDEAVVVEGQTRKQKKRKEKYSKLSWIVKWAMKNAEKKYGKLILTRFFLLTCENQLIEDYLY